MTPRRTDREPSDVPDFGAEGLRRLLATLPAGATVLEVGPGPGWDVDFLEAHGVAVRRTDITGDDLGGPYDAVLALGVLEHGERSMVPAVLGRIVAALTPGGSVLVAIRDRAGEQRDVGDPVDPCLAEPWLEPDVCDLLEDAGLELDWRASGADSARSRWLVLAARA